MDHTVKKVLEAMLAVEVATLKAQRAFALNTQMNYIEASVTEARIAAIEGELFPELYNPCYELTKKDDKKGLEAFRKDYYKKKGWKYYPPRE